MKVLSVRLFLNVVYTDSRVRLAAEATTSQPVNILESVKYAHQLRGRGFRAAVLAVLGCGSESGPEVVFCTHTNAPTPTLTSAHTNTHVARQQKCVCTGKKILDDPCAPANHNQRMHKGKGGQASRHMQNKSWPRWQSTVCCGVL